MIDSVKKFDSLTCELSGVNLVEASAGTGKTYNIQNLVGRSVLEGWDITSVLVVTFTKAATSELKDRIRTILKKCKFILENPSVKITKELKQSFELVQ